MKKSLLILLAIIFAINLNTQAEDFSAVYNGDTIYYNITSSTSPRMVEVTYRGTSYSSYYEYSGVVSIPDSVIYNGNYYKVTSIGNNAFSGCGGLISITIPNSVTSIGDVAFSNCYGLTSITIGNSVTSIGMNSFNQCYGLTSFIIPNSVTTIGALAFSNCVGLTSITIPNSVTSIEGGAFSYCYGLNSVTIGKSVNSIYMNAFQYCINLDSVYFNAINCNYMGIQSNLVFQGCTNLSNVIIGDSVTNIPDYAFCECIGLTSITIPNSVTTIGEKAFFNTPWYNNKPDGVVYINNILYKFKGLMPPNTTINVQAGTESIYNYAFEGCNGLTSIIIPNSLISIGKYAFADCIGLTSISIPNFVTSINDFTFFGCSGLTSITIPSSVTSIGNSAFMNCSGLTSITIPSSVTSIGNNAFSNCSGLTSITIPNSVTSIDMGVFADCIGLTSISIPNSVAFIGNYAFKGCSGLNSITIPNSIFSIGEYAFKNCINLSSITSSAIYPPDCSFSSFDSVNNNIPVFVPCNSFYYYSHSFGWGYFTNIIGMKTVRNITTSICQDDVYTDYGANIDSAGIYTLVNGCDSVILNLSVNPSYNFEHFDTICQGSVFNNYGFSFTADTSVRYTRNLQAINGCDSIIRLNLQVVKPQKVELEMVTVDLNNNNVVVWNKDKVVNHYNIYKEGNVLNQYDLIATVPYDSASMFVDTNSNPTIKAYMYKISTTDTCLNESELSSFHKTMHLTISQGIGNNWNLYWSPYEGAYYTTYNIYRGLNSLDSLEYLTTISSSNTSYTDIDVPSQIVYYQVEIIKDTNTTNKSGIQSIRSNIVTNNTIGLNNIHKNNITTKLYPNPTEGKAKLEIEGLSSDVDVLVYDMVGRVIQKHRINQGTTELDIDLSGYAKGVYNIRIMNDEIRISRKLIVN